MSGSGFVINPQEEMFWFPECERRVPGSQQVNIAQHEAFQAGFEQVEAFFHRIREDPSNYDGAKVIAMIDGFGEGLVAHLRDEIDTFAPVNMRKIFDDPLEAKAVNEKAVKWIVSNASPTTSLPFVLYFWWKVADTAADDTP